MEDKIKNNENDMLSIGEFNEILQQKNFNMRDTLKNKEFSLYNLKKEKENTKDFIDEGINEKKTISVKLEKLAECINDMNNFNIQVQINFLFLDK